MPFKAHLQTPNACSSHHGEMIARSAVIRAYLSCEGLVSHHNLFPHKGTLGGLRRKNLPPLACLEQLFYGWAAQSAMRVFHSGANLATALVFFDLIECSF